MGEPGRAVKALARVEEAFRAMSNGHVPIFQPCLTSPRPGKNAAMSRRKCAARFRFSPPFLSELSGGGYYLYK